MRIRLGGHRGLGMTDSAFAQKRNAGRRPLPPENTLESLLGALREGADFIETDAIATADDEVALVHSDDPSMHIVVPQDGVPGKRFIDEMTLAEVQSLHTGLSGKGRIPSLRELLRGILKEFPGDSVILNLELKGIQATERATADAPPLVDPVLRILREEGFPLSRVLFSSFSVKTLEELAAKEPAAKMALAFYTAPPGSSFADTVLYADGSEHYVPFTIPDVRDALKRLPTLSALVPEIQDLTPGTVALAAEKGLSILTYGYPEESPLLSDKFGVAARRAMHLCRMYNVDLGLMTDFLADMRKVAEERPAAPTTARKKVALTV
jgi:glycerophosphoryl diester phosphodiesterase